MKNTKKGFTLVELLVVIAILAILSTIAIVGYTSFIRRAEESVALDEVYQAYRATYAEDINRPEDERIVYGYPDNIIVLHPNETYIQITPGGQASVIKEGTPTHKLAGDRLAKIDDNGGDGDNTDPNPDQGGTTTKPGTDPTPDPKPDQGGTTTKPGTDPTPDQGGTTKPDDSTDDPEEDEEETTLVSGVEEFANALKDPAVTSITLSENIILQQPFTIDRNLTINLNGNTITSAKNVVYPNSVVLNVEKDTEVVIKGGTLANRTSAIEPDMDFIRVRSGATLVLDNVDITITVTPEIYWNKTRKLWQMDPAEHRIFVLGSNSSLTLNNSSVYVVSPEVNNYPSYERNMSIVGVYFSTNASNSKFVMNGGSFTMLSTAPEATKKTDSLCFISSARDINAYPDATNTVSLNGEVEIIVGAPDNTGKLNSTNNLYYFGPGYYSGKTYYSGVKYIEMSADTIYNIDGYAHSLNTGDTKVWDVEDRYMSFGTRNADKEFYNSEEIKYHVVCTNVGYSCTYEGELTLSQITSLPTTTINSVTYHKCSSCSKGGLVVEN